LTIRCLSPGPEGARLPSRPQPVSQCRMAAILGAILVLIALATLLAGCSTQADASGPQPSVTGAASSPSAAAPASKTSQLEATPIIQATKTPCATAATKKWLDYNLPEKGFALSLPAGWKECTEAVYGSGEGAAFSAVGNRWAVFIDVSPMPCSAPEECAIHFAIDALGLVDSSRVQSEMVSLPAGQALKAKIQTGKTAGKHDETVFIMARQNRGYLIHFVDLGTGRPGAMSTEMQKIAESFRFIDG
jgi:hypothetical protein